MKEFFIQNPYLLLLQLWGFVYLN